MVGIFSTAVLVTLFASLQFSANVALQFTISPNNVTQGAPQVTVDVKCSPDADATNIKEVFLMKIGKKGEKAMVFINSKNKITFGHEDSIPAEMKADGELDTKDPLKSFLSLELFNPSKKEMGTYTCTMYHYDTAGVMKEDHASQELSGDFLNFREISKDLLARLGNLEDKLKEHNITGDDFKGSLGKLLENTGNHSININNLFDKNSKVLQNMARLLEKTGNHSTHIDKLHEQGSGILKILDGLEQKFGGHGVNIKKLIDQAGGMLKGLGNLKDKNGEHASKIKQLFDKAGGMLKGLGNLKDKTGEHASKIKQLFDKVKEVKDKVDKNKNDNQNNVVTRPGAPVAFSAALDNFIEPAIGSIIKFRDVTMKVGNGYDSSSGVFTAPKKGVYVFHLSLMMACTSCRINVDIRANDRTIATLHAGDASYINQSAVSSAALLERGDQVKVVVASRHNGNQYKGKYSVFTGYLVQSF